MSAKDKALKGKIGKKESFDFKKDYAMKAKRHDSNLRRRVNKMVREQSSSQ